MDPNETATPCKGGTAMPTQQPRRMCGSTCRDGHPCRNDKLLPNGRCRMHGGKSLRGVAHPNFRHGQYSQDLLARVAGAVSTLRETGAVVETLSDYRRVLHIVAPDPPRRK